MEIIFSFCLDFILYFFTYKLFIVLKYSDRAWCLKAI